MRKKMKPLIGILFSLVMVLSLMPAMSLRALAEAPYASLKNTTTAVKFDNKNWYLIDYDASTVTLLSKDCIAETEFAERSNRYSGSKAESVVNNYYNKIISDDDKAAVSGNGMFLLTIEQVKAMPIEVRMCSQYPGSWFNDWWLSSPGHVDTYVAAVNGDDGSIDEFGYHCKTWHAIRPALKLNLSSVIFSSDSNTFYSKYAATILKAPTAKTLDFNNSAQELVIPGEAICGTMQYALGENETTAPETGWSTATPTGTKGGTYYVWYKAVGDYPNHSETKPMCVKAVIIDIYAPIQDTTTVINFDDKEWYLIDHDGSTVTLLTKECVGLSQYNYRSVYVEYEESIIKGFVDTFYADNISAAAKTAVSGNGMFLLTSAQADAIHNADVRKCTPYSGNNAWWLSSCGGYTSQTAFVLSESGYRPLYGHYSDIVHGVRPALKLNLSAVNFSDNSFSLKQTQALTILKAPTATTLDHTGLAQNLVTEGQATGGTMQYALGGNETTAPKTGWSTAIPTGTETGTYYVWYKAVADDGSKSETVPECVTAVIAGSGAADDPDPTIEEGVGGVYRLYNPYSGDHLFTQNVAEKDYLITLGWKYEGVAWYAPEFPDVPVYRLYNPNNGDHHYTTDVFERDHLIEIGWYDEGIGWYSEVLTAVPVYRLYNPNALLGGAHHFTVDMAERDHLIELGWKDEGIGWYGMYME